MIYIITLIKRRKKFINFMRIYWFFIWTNSNPRHPKMLYQIWLILAQWFWRRGFFNFVNVFSRFCNYLPLEKGGVLRLKKHESPSPKNALCQVWLKVAQLFWRKRWKCARFTDRWTTTNKMWSQKLTWAFSSGELTNQMVCTALQSSSF